MRFHLVFLFSYIIISFLLADEPIALVTKSRGNAKHKISSENKFRSNAQVNTPIFQGDKIKTKSKSFNQIVYLDDQSTISIYPNTEITVYGTIESRIISKQINVTEGIVRVKVSNQITSEFELTTPHSQLTCYKCDFWLISDIITGDRFYKISGNGFVINPSMIQTMELKNDTTILSLKDTIIEIAPTSINESQYLELLMFDAGEIPEKSVETLTMHRKISDQMTEITSNVVEIRLKNALKMERRIILTYTK